MTAMIEKFTHQEPSLQGKLLIAQPSLLESCFEKSVVFMCHHDATGAIGLIINHPVSGLDAEGFISQFNLDMQGDVLECSIPVHFGGPVDLKRGFVLHSADYQNHDTMLVDETFGLTANKDVVKDILAGKGPQKALLAIGYAGWGEGQLDEEIESGSWISVGATESLVFSGGDDDVWHRAMACAGVKDPLRMSPHVGHA